jgi:alkylation response protein AidB-like acyl-CoA dehydrogenase
MTATADEALAVPGPVLDAIAADAAAVDHERSFPRAALDALADAGLLGLAVPAQRRGAC